MLETLEELRLRRCQLQVEHDADKAAFEATRKHRMATNYWDLKLLQQEKFLQDKMFRSFVELASAVSCEQELEIARLTKNHSSKDPLKKRTINGHLTSKKIINDERNKPGGGALPLKKRHPSTKRAKLTSRKEFYHKCEAMHRLVSQPPPPPYFAKVEECSSAAIFMPPSQQKKKPDPMEKKPDPPGLGTDATASLFTLAFSGERVDTPEEEEYATMQCREEFVDTPEEEEYVTMQY